MKFRVFFFVMLFFALVLFSNSKTESIIADIEEEIKHTYLNDCNQLLKDAAKFSADLEVYQVEGKITAEHIKRSFLALKRSYKKIEYFVEYLDPELAEQLNGAPIPKVVVEKMPYLSLKHQKPVFTTHPPEGLQLLEEILFADELNKKQINDAQKLSFVFEERALSFRNSLYDQHFTSRQYLESFREQIIRVIALGITGFDVPLAGTSIENCRISLLPVLNSMKLYQIKGAIENEEEVLKAIGLLEKAVSYLENHKDFDSFDRMYFIREIADPAYMALTALIIDQNHVKKGSSFLTKPVNDSAKSVFSVNFLQPSYYSKYDQQNKDPEIRNLGKILFFDPILSSNNKRACASCHSPSKAFTDGLAKSLAFDFKGNVRRNSPTLINAIFSNAFFWDGRSEFIQDQISEVVLNADEFHESYEGVVKKLVKSNEYQQLFKKAFKKEEGGEINQNKINRAISSYVQSLVALNAPFDRYMRKETNHLNLDAVKGFNLFMGKASCGTCHFAPIFNGTVPPRYTESETEVLGVPVTANFSEPEIDSDSGRAEFINADAFLHSFKTTTVRNAALTAPYMHNGAFKTLEEVIEFYDLGGGIGLGLDVPNQTLPSDSLNLTSEEKNQLIAFIHSLTDTTAITTIPTHLPSFPENAELNKRIVGGEY